MASKPDTQELERAPVEVPSEPEPQKPPSMPAPTPQETFTWGESAWGEAFFG